MMLWGFQEILQNPSITEKLTLSYVSKDFFSSVFCGKLKTLKFKIGFQTFIQNILQKT